MTSLTGGWYRRSRGRRVNWHEDPGWSAPSHNTLRYRLQRIREVSGYDLGRADTRFNLQLASRAWRTTRILREP